MTLTAATFRVRILRSMRKTLVCLALLALALPVAAVSAVSAGEGTLSVEDGRGKISLDARGGVIGRLDRGTLTIYDKTPGDQNFPVVNGADAPEVFFADGSVRYRGTGLRFRVIGGGFRIAVQGRGIDLSVVGKGDGFIEADDSLDPGVYSLDGADCRKDRGSCKVLPQPGIRFKLLIQGRGIDLSVVGKGSGFIEGDTLEPGVYSLDGADCRKSRASCELLPEPGIRFRLGAPERPDKSSAGSG